MILIISEKFDIATENIISELSIRKELILNLFAGKTFLKTSLYLI